MTSGRDDVVRVFQAPEPPKYLSDWCAQGVSDGLGDRLLMYDDSGEPAWEVLRVHHDLAATPGFRDALLQRLEQLTEFQHSSFPKVRAVEDFAPGSAPLLASSHTPGRRLSEAFTAAGNVALAMTLIRDLTTPLAALHRHGEGLAHGALAAGRISVTTDGRLLIRDHVFGAALDLLRFSPAQAWARLGVVLPSGPRPGAARVDVLQIALIALSSLVGRCVGPTDYPERVEDLLDQFALFPPLRNWLDPALDLKGSGFESAREAEEAMVRLFPEKPQGESQVRALLSSFAQSGASAGPSAERGPSVRRFIGGARVRPQFATEPRRLIETRPIDRVEDDAESLDLDQYPGEPEASPMTAAETQAMPPPTEYAAPRIAAVDQREGSASPSAKKSPVMFLQAEEEREAAAAVVEKTPDAVHAAAVPPQAQPRQQAGWTGRATTEEPPPSDPRSQSFQSPAPGPHPSPGDSRPFNQAGSLKWVIGCVVVLAIGQAVIVSQLYFKPPVIVVPAVPPPAVSSPAPRPEASIGGRLSGPPPEADPPSRSPSAGSATGSVDAGAPDTVSLKAPPLNVGGVRLTSAVELFAFEGERLLGSSKDGPIVLPVGRHDLELVNSGLGYRSLRTVTIKGGEILSMKIEPGNGSLNINASPWAEVWVDGKSVGETPIGNFTASLGEHEIVFRHPQLGEKREKVLVRANGATRVAVSFAP